MLGFAKRLFGLGRSFDEKIRNKNTQRAAARKLYRQCPVCRGTLAEHAAWTIATAEIGSTEDRSLSELITSKNWGLCLRYHVSNWNRDVRAWDAIKCVDGRIAILEAIMPSELWDDDRVEGTPIVLGSAESHDFDQLVAGRWSAL